MMMPVWEYTLTTVGLKKWELNDQETLEIMDSQKKKTWNNLEFLIL